MARSAVLTQIDRAPRCRSGQMARVSKGSPGSNRAAANRAIWSPVSATGEGTDGWTFLYASGLSGDGRVIVGDAIAPDGLVHGFVAVVPAPASAAAAVLAAAPLLRRRRRTG